MAHMAGKDLFRKTGEKLDQHSIRTPWTGALHDILRELYTPEEAEVLVGDRRRRPPAACAITAAALPG